MSQSPMHEQPPSAPGPEARSGRELDWADLVWLALGLVAFAVAAVVAYRPGLADGRQLVMSTLPWVALAGMSGVFLHQLLGLAEWAKVVITAITIGAWSVLVFDDDRWSILTFALFALAYSAYRRGPIVGIALAGAVAAVWAGAWIADGAPPWTIVVPLGVFVVGSVIYVTIYRSEQVNAEQADLIARLTEAQDSLAASERSKGVLEERARMASEIHDTLAQGLTSIVLLSRAAQRSGRAAEALPAIEATAQENLDAARRLIDAIRPAELDMASLPDALQRHLSAALPADVEGELRVVGEPRRLNGSVEVTILRAAQEALLNVRTHARANQVDVTLSYLDDAVALDVRDDGIGFEAGTVSNRGSLTGGQGLNALEQRARSLAGTLTLEAKEGGGSVLSVLLPADRP